MVVGAMTVDDHIRVIHFPDYTDRNPYQRKLIESLHRHGIVATVAPVSWNFPIIRGWISDGRPGVVHLHWITPFIGTKRWWIAALLGVRTLVELMVVKLFGADIVWTVHNKTSHERRNPRVDLAMRAVVARISDQLIVHCESARSHITSTYRLPSDRTSDIHVVPHGNYLESYPHGIDRSAARRSLNIPNDRRVLLYFGLIRPYKNVPDLIDSFRRVAGPDDHLLVVGDPWSSTMRTKIAETIGDDGRITAVLEFVDDDAVQQYMAAADAVVLPFQSVLTSGSVLLAMTFGRAVVVPSVGCPGELIGRGGGITYDDGATDGLEQALATALEPSTPLHKMGQRNRRVAEAFDWDTIGSTTVDIYRGLSPSPIDWAIDYAIGDDQVAR